MRPKTGAVAVCKHGVTDGEILIITDNLVSDAQTQGRGHQLLQHLRGALQDWGVMSMQGAG